MKILIIEKGKFDSKEHVKITLDEKAVDGKFKCCEEGEFLEIKIPRRDKINWRQSVVIPRKIVSIAKKNAVKKIFLEWENIKDLKIGHGEAVAEAFGVNFEMANYEFVKYKTVPKEGWNFIDEIVISVPKDCKAKVISAFKKGQTIGKEINVSRELSNTSGGDMTPEMLVREAKKNIKGTDIKINVLDEKQMQKLGMNSILAVGKGSKEESRFIILEHGNPKEKNPIVLIGKGVTFDSGGLNIKPDDSMLEMNMDMSGGAAVIHTVIACAKLGIKRRVIGLVPAVESMPSGESLRPGDIIKSMSGKTIEVQNTDAEGRIILADANTYAEKYKPSLVVNVATLTGAVSIALGERASGIMTKNREISDLFCLLGEESGDYVWPLPFWDEYEEEIKGQIGDVCNIRNRSNTRYGGTILGGMFIYQFAKSFPKWVHIDIGSKMTAIYDEHLAAGSCGTPIRLLVKLLEKY